MSLFPTDYLEDSDHDSSSSSSLLTLSIALRTPFLNRDGQQFTAQHLAGKIVGLYFATSWSPQCRDATPKIIKKYLQIQQQYPNQFEILFIPDLISDSSSYEGFFQTMPWLMLHDATGQQHFHDALGDYFELDELPAMVILNRDTTRIDDVDIDEFLETPFDKITDLIGYNEKCRETENEMMKKMPDIICHSSHIHPLKKTLNPYNKSGFDCDLCDKRVTLERHFNEEDGWSFHCEECGYDLHAVCASKDHYHQMLAAIPNIDRCIDCGENYILSKVDVTEENPTGTDYACSNRCVHPPPSEIRRKYLNIGISDINNSLPPWNRTLLHSAVLAHDPDLVWYLLKKGANPYLLDHQGASAISLAKELWAHSTLSGLSPNDDEAIKRSNRAKLIYDILPKMDQHLTSPDDLELPPPPTLHMARAHSEGGVFFNTSRHGNQSSPLFQEVAIKTRRHRNHSPILELESLPVPPKISSTKSVRSELYESKPISTGSLLDRGLQPFTSLTLSRLTSKNETSETHLTDSNWNTLQRLTLAELSSGIIEPDISLGLKDSKDNLSSPKTRIQHKIKCNACFDEFPFTCLGYSCTRIGCPGALCLDCLGRLAYVTVTSALYAVPTLKCPLCHDRISTIVWTNALSLVPATAEQVEALKRVDHSTHVDNMNEFIGDIADIVVAHSENFPPEVIQIKVDDDLFYQLDNIFEALKKLFKHYNVSYGHLIDHLTKGVTNMSDQSMTLAQFTQHMEVYLHDASPWSRYYQLGRHESEVALIQQVEGLVEYDPIPDEFLNTIQDIVVPFLIYILRFLPGVVGLLSDAVEDDEDDDDDDNYKTLGTLLLSKYLSNADALLKILCGQCHETVGLFYVPDNGFAIPSSSTERQNALNDLLTQLPESERLPFLRTFLSYSSGTLSSIHFIKKLYQFWCQTSGGRGNPPVTDNLDEMVLPSEITESTRDFFRYTLSLLHDIERRLTAQLTLFRTFPKISTPCCGTPHCFMCKVRGHHPGKTCEEVQEKEVGIAAQHCPGCGVPTLRTEGCSSITCVCGMTWEWEGGEDDDGGEEDADQGGDQEEGEDNEEDEWEDCEDEDDEEIVEECNKEG